MRSPVSDAAPRSFDVRHLQMARAAFAAIAAIMITFSSDHSAAVGMPVFSGFAMATAIVLLVAAWLVVGAGRRWTVIVPGALTLVAGMVSSLPGLRTTEGFFVTVIVWAALVGIAELVAGILEHRAGREGGREMRFTGILALLLVVGLLLVNPAYRLDYVIPEAGRSFSLTGITIGVGLFGFYTAIVAVYLAIAAFSPRTPQPVTADPADTDAAGGPA